MQSQIKGREFTCDVLMDASGAIAGGVARWRLETKAGISTKGETFDNADVLHLSGQVLKAVELIGPANVQGFVTEDGGVAIHEVNPRFSGGLPLSLAAGADLVEEYLRAIMGAYRPARAAGRSSWCDHASALLRSPRNDRAAGSSVDDPGRHPA